MELVILSLMTLSLLVVITIDAVQKRQLFLMDNETKK